MFLSYFPNAGYGGDLSFWEGNRNADVITAVLAIALIAVSLAILNDAVPRRRLMLGLQVGRAGAIVAWTGWPGLRTEGAVPSSTRGLG
jgi:hypothetical protein